MAWNLYSVIAALPAALGFGVLIFYLFTKRSGAGNAVSLQTLELIKTRSRDLPALDNRLTGKEVLGLLKTDENLRKIFTTEELKIIDGVRRSERRQQWFAFVFLCGTVVLSLLLYLLLVWKPWEHPQPHPINHFAVEFSMSRPVPPDMNDVWKTIREKAEASLKTGNKTTQLNEGFAFNINVDKPNSTSITDYRVTIMPGTPIWDYLWAQQEAQPPNIGAIKLLMFNATVILTDSALPDDMTQFNPSSVRERMGFMIASALHTSSIPLTYECDFKENRYSVHSSSYVPMIVANERWVHTWEELSGLTVVLIMDPINGEDWVLDFLRLHSELGLQYSIPNKAIRVHDRTIDSDGKSRIFTASLH